MPLFSRQQPLSFAQKLDDPDFLFMVGRAIGNMERVGHWLTQQEQPAEAKSTGEGLLAIAGWFFQQPESQEKPSNELDEFYARAESQEKHAL